MREFWKIHKIGVSIAAGAAVLLAVVLLVFIFSRRPAITLLKEEFSAELGDETVLHTGPEDYAAAKDSVLEETDIDLSKIDINTVGVYPAAITYKKKVLDFTVKVEDTTAPKVILNRKLAVEAGHPLYASQMLADIAERSEQVTVTFQDHSYSGKETDGTEAETGAVNNRSTQISAGSVSFKDAAVIYTQTGEYDNRMIVTDASGNQCEAALHITAGNKPVLTGTEELCIEEGGTIDYLTGVTAADFTGADITASVTVDYTAVDTAKSGSYPAVYTVADSYGFIASVERTIVITEQEDAIGTNTTDEEKGKAGTESPDSANTGGGAASGGIPDNSSSETNADNASSSSDENANQTEPEKPANNCPYPLWTWVDFGDGTIGYYFPMQIRGDESWDTKDNAMWNEAYADGYIAKPTEWIGNFDDAYGVKLTKFSKEQLNIKDLKSGSTPA